jgi:antitoxin component YwqK of YwqJK toxin-antitoxin module
MDMFIDCLHRKPELRDYKSLEKDIIKNAFNLLPYMDMWISSIIEGYIYDVEEFEYEEDEDEEHEENEEEDEENEGKDIKHFCLTRYGVCNGNYTKYIIISKEDEPEVRKVLEEGYYKDGKLDGEFKTWWDNNILKELRYYEGGKINGELKAWFKDGQMKVHFYIKDGKKEGEFKMWHENGELSSHQYFKDDKNEGEHKEYYETGQLFYQQYPKC